MAELPNTRTIASLPPEIIEQAISYLDTSTLRNLRLVAQQWNHVAVKYLFEHVAMTPSLRGLSMWQSRLNNAHIASVIRSVLYNTSPVPDHKSSDGTSSLRRIVSWLPYTYWLRSSRENTITDVDAEQHISRMKDQERYEQFYNSFAQLVQLSALSEVNLHFEPRWRNQGLGRTLWPPIERPGFQELILSMLFGAISNRSNDANKSIVKALCVENLQDVPLIHPECMQSVMDKLDRLKLVITEREEDNDEFRQSFLEDRRLFFTHLKQKWLIPISSHLKSLDLAFHGQWGSFTGDIKARELSFPMLTRLRLERFAPATDASFEWIFTISSLKTLILHDCQIVSYMFLRDQEIEDWELNVGSLRELDSEQTYGSDHRLFHYSGNWAHYFERIGKALTNLAVFRFDGSDYETNIQREQAHVYRRPSSPIPMADSRYTLFDTSMGASPWRSPDKNGDLWSVPYPTDLIETNIARKNFESDFAEYRKLIDLLKSRQFDTKSI